MTTTQTPMHRLKTHSESVRRTYEITGVDASPMSGTQPTLYQPDHVTVDLIDGRAYVTVMGFRVLKSGQLSPNRTVMRGLSYGGEREWPDWLCAIVQDARDYAQDRA